MRTFSAAGAVIAGLVALVAGGCASVDDAQEPTSSVAPSASPVQQDPSPEAAYDAWLAALSDHDAAAACSHHAPDFTIELRHAAILEDRAELGDPCVGFVVLLWEDPTRQYSPTAVEVTEQTAERARLAVTFPGVDESVVLLKRHDDWVISSTSPRTEGRDARTAR